jgi:hypothetical protein
VAVKRILIAGTSMRRTGVVASMIALLLVLSAAAAEFAPAAAESGSFEFRATNQPAITVWYYLPAARTSNTPVVFLLHGDSRTGREARDLGTRYALEGRFILLAPEFSERHFPGDSYSFGGMVDARLQMRPRHAWTLLIIEQLFDHIRARWQLSATTYDAIGHSGGGQYLHRLVLFVPEARFRRAIASSPGRYAFPTSTPVPYGMGGTDAPALLRKAFRRDFVLLLADRDTTDRQRETEAMAQGTNRFARGLRFFAEASEQAVHLGVELRWQLRLNHGADHSPQAAIEAAFKLLSDADEWPPSP